MIGAPKRSLPTPTVTPGRFCLLQSKHPPFVVRRKCAGHVSKARVNAAARKDSQVMRLGASLGLI